jgi:enamine deaminase RidA (YjgF/YER057c/UK114 family)
LAIAVSSLDTLWHCPTVPGVWLFHTLYCAKARLRRVVAAITMCKPLRPVHRSAGDQGYSHMKRPRPAKDPSAPKNPPPTSIEPLLTVPIPHTSAKLARGIRAGRWVFATGQCGTDYVNGIAPEVLRADHPFNGESQYKRESRKLYRNVAEVLAQVGAGFPDVVRVDQYYTTARAMHPYHEVRHEVFNGTIPPSTSNLHQRFARTGQAIEVQVMAAVPGAGLKVRHETFSPSYKISPVSGYSPALSAGDFRFVPGQTGEARKENEGPLDPTVRHPRSLWRQWPIKLETQFIITQKLKASLEGAGASLDSVVKAQVYLSDREDVPGFNEVWLSHFKSPPATTIIATTSPGFAISDLRIEINTISLATRGKTKREVIRGPEPPLFDGWVSAVKCGDLLFLSGLIALEGGRLIEEARLDSRQPFYGIPVKEELRSIIRQAEAICRAGGTSIRNAVRIQQFHTDLADLPAAIEVWAETTDNAPLPLSAIEVAWLPVAGARVMVDLWVHVPGGDKAD